MLTAIVLLWIAIKLHAPLWVFAIIVLMFLASALSYSLHVIEKIQKRRIEDAIKKFDEGK